MEIPELTEAVRVQLSLLSGPTNDKRFKHIFPYVIDSTESDYNPYIYFVFDNISDNKYTNGASSCENHMTIEYIIYIVRNYNKSDRYSTELAIQKDLEEVLVKLVDTENIIDEVYSVQLTYAKIDDENIDSGKSKVATMIVSFDYINTITQ